MSNKDKHGVVWARVAESSQQQAVQSAGAGPTIVAMPDPYYGIRLGARGHGLSACGSWPEHENRVTALYASPESLQ
jgi:hypothetical protein